MSPSPSAPTPTELTILRLGSRGEGVAQGAAGAIYLPFGAPGDRVLAEVEGERGRILSILEPGPDRVAPFCGYFGRCGGCALQTLAAAAYSEWKRGLVAQALRGAGLAAEVGPLVDAHGEGRRRATFHARVQDGAVAVGFMKARAHEVVAIEACPLFAPGMAGALPAAAAVAQALARLGKPLDLMVTASDAGLDLDLRGAGALDKRARARLVAVARGCDLARLSLHGETLVAPRSPDLAIGGARVTLPPGAFLQATAAGELALWTAVREGLAGARRAADLFAGLGAFALRIAESARVHAVDADRRALDALAGAAGATPGLRSTTTEARDLFRRPLAGAELDGFDAVVFDPPRAGAEAQARALARSKVPRVIAVSCAPGTFARDAAILVAGGYSLDKVTPIDQFRSSAHVEIAALFSKASPRPARPLLG